MSDFEDQAASIIDTSWHFSWHWERGKYGQLTINGYEKMLADAKHRIAEAQHQVITLQEFIPKIEAELEKRKRWAEEDLESNSDAI